MKKLYRKGLAAFMSLALLFSVSSCDIFDLDINTDPNNPSEAAVNLLLANTISNASSTFAGGLNDMASGFMVQSTANDDFNLNNGSWNGTWNFLYSGPLKDLNELIEAAEAQGNNPHYLGVGQVLKAYYFSLMVDLWGDVPYTEAFQGDAEDAIKEPVYDDDASIYPKLIALCDSAVANLSLTSPVTVSGDLIYNGNASRWRKAAKSLKLRLLLQSRNVSDVADDIQALITEGDLILTAADDFQYRFPTAQVPDLRHPWYQAGYSGGEAAHGYFAHQFMYEMIRNGDPRTPFYFKRQSTVVLNVDDPTDKQTIPCSQRDDCVYGYFPTSNFVVGGLTGGQFAPDQIVEPLNLFFVDPEDSLGANVAVKRIYPSNGSVVRVGQKVALLEDEDGIPLMLYSRIPGIFNASVAADSVISEGSTVLATVDLRTYLAGMFGRDRADPSGVPNDNPIRTTVGSYPAGGLYDDVAELGGQNKGPGNGIFPMITSWMVKFYMAEAMITLNATTGKTVDLLLTEAMTEQFTKVNSIGIADPNAVAMDSEEVNDFIAAVASNYPAAGTDNQKLQYVLKQAWFANFGNGFESYNAFRRTGLPADLMEPLQLPRQFALRLPYAQDELNLNGNTPVIVYDSPAAAVFWDTLKFQF